MRKGSLLLVSTLAAAVLATAVSTAPANRLATSEDNFRAIWSALKMDAEVGGDITCAVTLLGSFHSRTLTKSPNALIGAITSASVGTCREGSATFLTGTLPWILSYNGFESRLPGITGITLRVINLAVENTKVETCLFRTDTSEPASFIAERNTISGHLTALVADPTVVIDIDDPDFFCDLAGNERLSGSATVTTPAGGQLRITLV